MRRHIHRAPFALVALAVAYVALTSEDVNIGQVPLKLPVVLAALAVWMWVRRGALPPLTRSVAAVGIAVPVVWFAITLLRIAQGDPAQVHGTTYALQHGSRFIYVLLFLPLADLFSTLDSRRADRIWLWPVYGVCAISLGLFVVYLAGVEPSGTNRFGPLRGTFSVEPDGQWRGFIVNQVLLIPAAAVLVARVLQRGWNAGALLGLAAILTAAYLAHARGLWLGISAGVLAVGALSMIRPRMSVARRAGLAVAAVAVAAAFVANADPHLGGSVARALVRTSELSGAQRYEQAPQLHRGIAAHPLLGVGLGATLPNGYRRSPDSPWSFELSYLQLLFQLGIVGLCALLFAPSAAIVRALRHLPALDGERRLRLHAAVGGLLGLLFAGGSNPYLMTSVGMLALAVPMAMVAALTASESSGAPRAG